jgi:alpha-methylacyl-CoA racemase
MPQGQTVQPLADVKVLDFSTLLPGPMAGLMLAEAGADVIKIERPESGRRLSALPDLSDADGRHIGVAALEQRF